MFWTYSLHRKQWRRTYPNHVLKTVRFVLNFYLKHLNN